MPTMTPATSGNDLHQLTFADLKRSVKHALTKAVDATWSSEGEIVNDALAEFCRMHVWAFLERPLSLDTTSGVAYIDLPDDFGQLLTLRAAAATTLLIPATLDELQRLRVEAQIAVGSGTWYAITAAGQGDDLGLPTFRLELFPTPAATASAVYTGTYRRLVKKLTSDTQVPDIPAAHHVALRLLCRAWALQDDHQDAAAMEWERAMQAIDRSRMYDAPQATFTTMRGAVNGQGVPDSPANISYE